MALAVTEQLNMKCLELCYAKPEPSDEVRAKAIQKFTKELTALDKSIGNNKFFMGDELSVYDFYHYDMWERAKVVHKDSCSEYKNLEALQKNFEDQEWFQEFKKSEKWHDWLNAPFATLNNDCNEKISVMAQILK